MKRSYPILLFVLLFAGLSAKAQSTPKTLLWKITGNQFSKPCYLYGTMHSADKRVYLLGDSVYSSLQFCEGFAMEIDPGEYVDTALNNLSQQEFDVAYKKAVESDLVQKGPEYYREQRNRYDSILIKLRQRYRDLSPRDIRRLEKAYKRRNKNDMRTLLDLYLFDLAKKQGKLVGGVEDITDQTSIKDELGNPFDPDEFLKNQRKKYADVEEWMITTYTEADLDKLHEFSLQSQTKTELSIVVNQRNNKMARRIDSLGNIRSTFCAVGAAHLPGDSGVISLLRKRGFTVTPVFSSKKIEPGDLRIDNRLQALITVTDEDSNYLVQLPARPTILTPITDKFVLKTYKELSNEILLMFGIYEDGDATKTLDKELDALKSFFSDQDIKLYSTNKIRRQETDGYEVSFRNRDGYLKMHMFYAGGKTYLFAAGSKDKDSLNAQRCVNFLSSYQMILNKPRREQVAIRYTSPDKAFMVAFPAQPKREYIKGDATYTREDITLFSSYDNRNKISYLVMLKEPFKGYYMDFDSSVIQQTVDEIMKGLHSVTTVRETIELDGYPALKVKVKGESDDKNQVIYSVLAIRQNRLYNLTARGLSNSENVALFDKFISSFRFQPYLETKFEDRTGGSGLFTVMAPSEVHILENRNNRLLKNNEAAKTMRTDYYVADSNKAMTYGITRLAFPAYYWSAGEQALLKEYVRYHFNDSLAVNNVYNNDSLLYSKTVSNGGLEGRELLLKSVLNNSYTRLRLIHYGDAIFIINSKADKSLLTDANADLFFNSFRFTNEKVQTTAFESKTAKLLNDLGSSDTVLSRAAYAALSGNFSYPDQDIPQMLDALLKDYPGFANKNMAARIPELITGCLSGKSSPELIAFIRTQYPLLKDKKEPLRMLMIELLAASGNAEAYQLLLNLVLKDPPAGDNYVNTLQYLGRSSKQAATLFPSIAAGINDERISLFVLDLANTLIDSNQLQYASIASYEEQILRQAKKMLKEYQEKNNDNFFLQHTYAIFDLLARINKKPARFILNDFTEMRNTQLTERIFVSLIKNNIPVPGDQIDQFCTTPELRILLYDDFVKVNRREYFTGSFASQLSFAKDFATIYTSNDIGENIPKYFETGAIKDTLFNKKMQRFYLFKVSCQFRRGEEVYTAIIGPFAPDASYLSIEEGKELFILYKNKYDVRNLDNLFKDFGKKIKAGAN